MAAVSTYRGADGDPSRLVDALMADDFEVSAPVALTTTLLDTFDGRLHAAGLRLERRGDTLALAGAAVTAQLAVFELPRFVTDLPPGPFRSRLAEIVDVRALLPVATLTSRRRRAVRRNGEGKVVASAEIVERLGAPGALLDGWFVAVDDLAGYTKQADALRELIDGQGAGAVEGDVVDLAVERAGIDPAGHQSEPTVPLDAEQTALDGFRLVLANLADTVALNLLGTIDDIDPEFLHDLRVAVRRSRSVLGHGKGVLPADVLEWARDDLKELGDLTSPPRDLDVYVLEWSSYVAALPSGAVNALRPVRGQLDADRDRAHDELAATLQSPMVTEMLGRWRRWLAGPVDASTAGPEAAAPLGEVVRRRIEKAQRRLVSQGRAITPTTPAEQVHELRKDAKKLRYLLECFGGLLPAAERKAFVKRLKALQDNLGEHQDAEVHVAKLREVVGEMPTDTPAATFVAIGQLIEQLELRRQAARDEFAERFADYDSKPTHDALRAVLAGADT